MIHMYCISLFCVTHQKTQWVGICSAVYMWTDLGSACLVFSMAWTCGRADGLWPVMFSWWVFIDQLCGCLILSCFSEGRFLWRIWKTCSLVWVETSLARISLPHGISSRTILQPGWSIYSIYTTHIFVNSLLYIFMWQHWRNYTLLQCKVVSVQHV